MHTITNYNVQNYKGNGVFGVNQALNQLILIPKGSHGLHQGSLRLRTMTALIKSFSGGVQGGQFFQKAPPLVAAGGKE